MFMVGGGGSWLEDAADYKLTNGFVLDYNPNVKYIRYNRTTNHTNH